MNILKALESLDHKNIRCDILTLSTNGLSNDSVNIRMATYVTTFASIGVSVDKGVIVPNNYTIDDLWGYVTMDYSRILMSTGLNLGEIYLLHLAAAKARIILPNGSVHKDALFVIEKSRCLGVAGA